MEIYRFKIWRKDQRGHVSAPIFDGLLMKSATSAKRKKDVCASPSAKKSNMNTRHQFVSSKA